jgi:hypothetical protein
MPDKNKKTYLQDESPDKSPDGNVANENNDELEDMRGTNDPPSKGVEQNEKAPAPAPQSH